MIELKNYKLSDVAEVFTGFPFKGDMYNDSKGIRVLRGENVSLGYLRWDTAKYWNEYFSESEKYSLENGDIVVGMDGSRVGRNRAQIRQQDLPLLLAQRVARIRSNKKFSQRLLAYIIKSAHFEKYVTAIHTGTSIPHISAKQIANFEFKSPQDLNIQKSIASILLSLDDKIELNLQMNQTLEELVQTVFNDWFVDFNFPDHDGNLFEGLPKNWQIKSLGEILDIIIDHRGKTPIKLGGEWVESGIPALSAKNVKDGKLVNLSDVGYITNELYDKWMKEKLKPFDILLTSEAPLGEVAILIKNTKYCLSQRVFAVRPNKKCSPAYLYAFLRSKIGKENVQKRATGSTVVGIRQSELKKVEILLPDNSIQKKFEDVARPLLSKIDDNYNEIETLTQLRDSLLPKLMTGKIEINAE